MLQDKYLNKLRELPEPVRQFGGLVTITVIVILFFAILNIFWGQGEELVAKMKKYIFYIILSFLIATSV